MTQQLGSQPLKVSLRRALNAAMALGVASTMAVLFSPTTLQFADGETSAPVTQEDCVVTVREDGGSTVECFDDFRAALAHATRGDITDAPMTAAEAVRDPEIRHQLGIGAYYELANHENTTAGSGDILSVEYEHRDLQGNSLIYRGGNGCDADRGVEWSVGELTHWNDEISSFVGANGCGVKHFEHQNFNGASTPWSQSDNYVGDAMNDRTSSIKWR